MNTKSVLLIGLLLQFFISSCSHQAQHTLLPQLEHAEAIMYTHPDSALHVLEQMQMPKTSDRLNHATWCLFLAQAKYKNYVNQSSDSLINIAHTYFMEQDDPQRKALTLYLEGGINEELGDVEKAMSFYLKAADEVEKTTDYRLGHLISIRLGKIDIYRELYDYAKETFERAYTYAELSENENYIANSLLCIGRVYSAQQNYDEAIKYYKKALDITLSNKEDDFSGTIIVEMSSIYRRKGDNETALQYALQGLDLRGHDSSNIETDYLIIGIIYHSLEKTDSAYYYLNRATLSKSIYTKRSTYASLYSLSCDEKKYKDAVEYIEQYQIYTDSIRNRERTSALIEIQEKYNKEKILNERNQLKIEKDRTLRTALLILISLLCIIFVLIYVYQRKLVRKERTIQKNEEQLRLYLLKVHENDALINRNKSRIQELSVELEQSAEMQELLEEQKRAIEEIENQNEALRKENEQFQESICHYSSTLQERSKELAMLNVLTEENLRLQDRERFLSNQLIKKTKILNDLKASPKYLSAAHWQDVTETVDWLYENYTKRLAKQLPSLTEADLQICCLIKLHLSVSEIAILLGISPNSVSRRKHRLKERIIQELGEPLDENKTLDLWLWEY